MKKVFLFAGISALLLSSCGNKQTQPKADDGKPSRKPMTVP